MSTLASPPTAVQKRPPGAPPRNKLWGGFLIDPAVVREWAQRLCPEVEISEELSDAMLIIDDKIRTYGCPGVDFWMLGEDGEEPVFMVITQRRWINGWKGMPTSLIRQLKMRALEVRVKQELEKEGIQDCGFKTILT